MGFFGALVFLGIALAAFSLASRFLARYQFLKDQLSQARHQLAEVIAFLNDFSRKLGTVEQINDALQLVVHHLCDVLRAESLGIYVVDQREEGGKPCLRGAAVAGMFPVFGASGEIPGVVLIRPQYRVAHFRHEFIAYGQGVVGEVGGKREPVLIKSAAEREDLELPNLVQTLIAVPMFANERFLGVICAVNRREEGKHFDEEDLRMLGELSCQAALASSLVKVYSDRSSQERMLQELRFGRDLQRSLLPARIPTWGEYRFGAFGEPALEVAGDYYDFVRIDEDRLMVVVADASGKGVPACMLMAMCRSFVHSLVEDYAGMERFLMDLNRRLFSDTDAANFLTMACVVVNRRNHVCEYGCAGHTPAFMRHGDRVSLSVRPEGVALGLLPNDLGIGFETLTFLFEAGTQLLLFTDGITEALNDRGEEFGEERLREIWSRERLQPEQTTRRIVEEVRKFVGKVPQTDDHTMMVIHREESGAGESRGGKPKPNRSSSDKA